MKLLNIWGLGIKFLEKCDMYMKKEYDVNNPILIEYKIENNETNIKIFG